MTYDVQGKNVLVTGASSGIGAGLAEAFARAGATVGIVARREDRLAEVLERCRTHAPQSRMWVADLADPNAVDALAAGAPGRARMASTCWSTTPASPSAVTSPPSTPPPWTPSWHINYSSPVRLTLALLPQMLERGEGRIVNLSSVAATLSPPGEAAYAATKAALTVFSESMAVDLWDTGVKVTVIYPGVVDTELFTPARQRPLQGPGGVDPRRGGRGHHPRRAGGGGRPGLRAGVVR